MTDLITQADGLIAAADQMEPGQLQVETMKEAVRLADQANDVRAGFDARMKLVKASIFSGFPEIALVAFTWCLAQFDKDMQTFGSSEWEVIWEYKWVLAHLPQFPHITKDQIEATLEDFARRVRRAGYANRNESYLRWHIACALRDLPQAEACFAQWRNKPRDGLSDCVACETNGQAVFLLYLDREAEALRVAEPLLQGRLRCYGGPPSVLSSGLCALVRAGRPREAERCHSLGYRQVVNDRRYLDEIGKHIRYLRFIGNTARALELFERHFPWLLATVCPGDRFVFAVAGRALMSQLTGSSGPLRLPQEFVARELSGQATAQRLFTWLDARCRELADQFDRRNGNDAFNRELHRVLPTINATPGAQTADLESVNSGQPL